MIIKVLLVVVFMIVSISGYSQDRKLKSEQPSMAQLMLLQVRLNPADTMLSYKNFSHLPVKHFPKFIADESQPIYSISQRDSIIRKVDELFFEMED